MKPMKQMEDFIREIKQRYGIEKQVDLAAKLGLTQGTISAHYNRSGRAKHYSEETAHRIAELLDLDPTYVLICLRAEAAKSEKVKRAWQKAEELLRSAVGVAVVGAVLVCAPAPSHASIAPSLYIMLNKFRRFFAWRNRVKLALSA